MPKIVTSLFGELNLITLSASLPAQESISFLTDVQKSVNENENREMVRDVPRRTISYNYSANPSSLIQTFNMLYEAIRDKIALPIWSDIQKVGEVLNNATSITCDTVYHDLRANSLALLWAFNGCQVVEISTITDTLINVSNSLKYVKNAYLIPIRQAHINGDITEKYLNFDSYFSVNFNIDDEVYFANEAPNQFLGNDIYTDPFLADSDGYSSINISKTNSDFDSKTGEIAYLSQVTNSKLIRNYRVVTDNLIDNKKSKNIIYRSAGQYNVFWMPTFKQDFQCFNAGVISTTLLVKSNDYDAYNTRKHIAIQLNDYSWIPVEIESNSLAIGGYINLNLATSLDINSNEIRCISYLGLCRFNSDNFGLNWLGNGVLETSNVIIEVLP